MLLVGLTGNIASGKSTVAQLLARRGATIIDADVLAREAIERGTPGFDAVVRRWGNAVLAPDGDLDRGALRRLVFGDVREREELNAIVHPRVEQLRERRVDQARQRGDRVVVCDVPLLFEKNMAGRFDRIVLVDAPTPARLRRLVAERGLPEAEAAAMIAAQMPADSKRRDADHVIENAGTLAELERHVNDVWALLARDADAP